MKISRIIFIFSLLAASTVNQHLLAQINGDGSMQSYKHDFEYGLALHTRGYSFNTKYCLNKSFNYKTQFDIDFVASMKHYREFTYRNTGARSFVFGKLNGFGILRATWGQQRVIADYENSMSVRVNLHYGIGPNAGLLKPEYYRISNNEGGFEDVKFDEQQHFYAGQFYGGSKWTKGLSELAIIPGVSGKLAMSFEWGKQDDQFKALETGIMVDLYGQRIPLMAFAKNDFVFINLYAAFMIGSRW